MTWKNDPYWCEALDAALKLSSAHICIIVPEEFVQAREEFYPEEQAKRKEINQITGFAIPKDRLENLPIELLKEKTFQRFHCTFANEVFVIYSSLAEDPAANKEMSRHIPTFLEKREQCLDRAYWESKREGETNQVTRLPYLLDTPKNRVLKTMFPHENYVMEMFRDLSNEPEVLQREVFKYCVKQVSLEISGYCNRNCSYCPVKDLKSRKDKSRKMPQEVLERCVEDLAAIHFSGKICFHNFNEPLANREYFLETLDYVRAKLPDSFLIVTTNGDYLTADYFEELCKHGANELGISIHYDDIWEREKQFARIHQTLDRIGIGDRGFLEEEDQRLIFNVDESAYDSSILKSVMLRTEDFTVHGSDRGGVLTDGILKKKNLEHCNAILNQFIVDCDGEHVPCCNICSDSPENRQWLLGNILNYPSIFSAYVSARAAKFRKILFTPRTDEDYTPTPCRTCSIAYVDNKESQYRLDDDARREIFDSWLSEEDKYKRDSEVTQNEPQKLSYIEKISKQIKEEIQLSGLESDIPKFASPTNSAHETDETVGKEQHLQESRYCTQLLEETTVYFYRPPTSYIRVFRPIVIFAKRVIRKLVRFLLEPMVEEINTNRKIAATALDELQEYVRLQSGEIDALKSALSELQTEKEILKEEVAYLQSKIRAQRKKRERSGW